MKRLDRNAILKKFCEAEKVRSSKNKAANKKALKVADSNRVIIKPKAKAKKGAKTK